MAGVLDYLSTKAPRWSAALWDGMLRTVDARFRPLEEALDAQREATSAIVARGLQVIEDELAPTIAEGKDVLGDIKDVLEEAEGLQEQAQAALAAAVSAGIDRAADGVAWLNYLVDGEPEWRAGTATNGAYQIRGWTGSDWNTLVSATLADGITVAGRLDAEALSVGGIDVLLAGNVEQYFAPETVTALEQAGTALQNGAAATFETLNINRSLPLPDGANLDEITDGGFYDVKAPTHGPGGISLSGTFYLVVQRSGAAPTFIRQELIDRTTTTVARFQRLRNNSGWQAWTRSYSSADFAPTDFMSVTGAQVVSGQKTFTNSMVVSEGRSLFVQTPTESGTLNNPAAENAAGAATLQPGLLALSRAANPAADLNRGAAGTVVSLRCGGVMNGSIGITTTGASFNTTSDHRLKTDVVDLEGSGAFIEALRPVDFHWLTDGTADQGFIAHEFATVCPRAVTGVKDEMGVDDDGNPAPIMQGMQASAPAVMANVIAELQSLRRRVAELEAASAV